MARRCKCGCKYELLPARQCTDFFEKKGYFDVDHMARHGLEKSRKIKTKALKVKVLNDDRSHWIKKAQAAFNKYVRLRDAKDPCISCGRFHEGQYHSGHYKSVGSSPELRFCELNNHKQCAPCNNHLSGNIVNYRPRLIDKIGLDKVEWLEGPHKSAKLSIDDIKSIEKKYKQMIKDLE